MFIASFILQLGLVAYFILKTANIVNDKYQGKKVIIKWIEGIFVVLGALILIGIAIKDRLTKSKKDDFKEVEK